MQKVASSSLSYALLNTRAGLFRRVHYRWRLVIIAFVSSTRCVLRTARSHHNAYLAGMHQPGNCCRDIMRREINAPLILCEWPLQIKARHCTQCTASLHATALICAVYRILIDCIARLSFYVLKATTRLNEIGICTSSRQCADQQDELHIDSVGTVAIVAGTFLADVIHYFLQCPYD